MGLQESIWDNLYKSGRTWKKETINLPELIQGKTILELGVGNGKTLQSILKQSPKLITAIDFSQEAIDKARKSIKSNKVTFLKKNVTSLPFKGEFDVIVCYYILNNLMEKEREKAIIEMKKALKSNGVIMFEDFAIGDFREKGKNIEQHTIERKDGLICHFFTEFETKSLFKEFKEIKISIRKSNPIRGDKNLERKIISAIIKK